jgi:hypothetical protein
MWFIKARTIVNDWLYFHNHENPGIPVAIYFDEAHHCKNLKFLNFGESKAKMASPGLLSVNCKDLW